MKLGVGVVSIASLLVTVLGVLGGSCPRPVSALSSCKAGLEIKYTVHCLWVYSKYAMYTTMVSTKL